MRLWRRCGRGDPAAAISSAALAAACELCVEALDIFVQIYAAEAGNLALKMLATAGVYIGGGIAPKILDELKNPAFLEAFLAKGRMKPLLEAIPVLVILNENTALRGAARGRTAPRALTAATVAITYGVSADLHAK